MSRSDFSPLGYTRRNVMKTAGATRIPGVLQRFLERASVAVGCTVDRALTPRIHYVSGWALDPDERSIWGFVPAVFEPGLRETIAEKGPFALTVEHIGPHECFQFKGALEESRPASEPDRALVARCRERFAAAVKDLLPHYAPHGAALRRYIAEPSLAFRVRVREIYVQTPGPGAGSLLARLEELR
jgi:hypothetical protein